MAKFTAPVDLNIRLPSGEEAVGVAGTTHRISDAVVEEFIRDVVPRIPGGVTWVTQDELSSATLGVHAHTSTATGGTLDHGAALTGLTDDDHTQYVRTTEGGLAKVQAIGTSGGTVTISPASANIFTVTASAALTIAFGTAQSTRASSPAAVAIEVHVSQDSTGGHSLTWPGSVTWIGGTPSPSTTASSKSIYALISTDGAVTWYGVLVGGNAGSDGQVVTSDGTYPVYEYPPGYQFTAAIRTSNFTVSAAAESVADVIISTATVAFDGSACYMEFYAPSARPNLSSGATLSISLFEDGTSLGRFAIITSQNTNSANAPRFARYFFTPTAGNHSYSIRAWVSTGSGLVSAGAASGIGTDMPAYIRIFKH